MQHAYSLTPSRILRIQHARHWDGHQVSFSSSDSPCSISLPNLIVISFISGRRPCFTTASFSPWAVASFSASLSGPISPCFATSFSLSFSGLVSLYFAASFSTRLISPISPICSPSHQASRPVSPAHSSPLPYHVSPPSHPIQSLAKKRRGDFLPHKVAKKAQSDGATTACHSSHISTALGRLPPGSTDQANETQSLPRLKRPTATLLLTNSQIIGKMQLCQRCNNSSSVLLSNPSPPAWFLNSLSMLQNNEPPLGDRWAELLRLWSAFEKEAFVEHTKLSAESQPLCIQEWIRRAHPTTWHPVIMSIPAFEKSFEAWWNNLQPDWRKNNNSSIAFDNIDGDWEKLRKAGLNGIHSIIVTLFYWGCRVQGSVMKCSRWASLVEDCILVLGRVM